MTGWHTNEREVAVVDLRGFTGDAERLADQDAVEGRLIVIDEAATLTDHNDVYNALLSSPRVSRLICVATGRMDGQDDGPVLARPSTLINSRRAGTLWVGDPVGVRWCPADGTARAVREQRSRSGLDQLVTFLREPQVFETALERIGTLPYGTASPGLRLLFAGVDEAELAAVEPQALRTVLDESAGAEPLDAFTTLLVRAGEEPGAADTAALVPGYPLDEARAAARAALDDAELAVNRLPRLTALIGRQRPGKRVFADIDRAGTATAQLHHQAGQLLTRMDGHLRAGRPTQHDVTELGVPEPAPVNRREIVEALRSSVPARLAQHRSPARLRREVGQQAATIAPQGCPNERKQLDALNPKVGQVPPFPAWPLPLAATPVVFLSCLSAAVAPGQAWQRWTLALTLALAWFGSGWLMLARRPGENGEAGWAESAPAAVRGYGLAAVAGTAAGLVAAHFLESAGIVLPWLGRGLVTAAVAVLPGVVLSSWPLAVGKWRRGLNLDGWRHVADETTRLVVDTTTHRWRPFQRHRVVADALVEVGNGVEAVVRGLTAAAGTLFPPPRQQPDLNQGSRAARIELLDTVVADLLDLTITAITPCWPAIEAGSRIAQADHTNRVGALLELYREHVRTNGIIAPPFAPAHDPRAALATGPRTALATQIWRQAPEAVMALQTRPDDEMTQLCRSNDLRDISASMTETGMVRQAPVPLRDAVDNEVGSWPTVRELHWTEGGIVAGTLRLVSIRAGAVRD